MSAPRDRSQRAQTAQDFAVGISIFLLAVAFVFAFVPQVLPATDGGQGQQSLADRAAATLIADTSLPEDANTLHGSEVSGEFLSQSWPNETLNDRLGLPETVQVNVTFRHLNGTRVDGINGWNASIGDSYGEQETVSVASRVVRFDESTGVCTDDPCRLVVRVW